MKTREEITKKKNRPPKIEALPLYFFYLLLLILPFGTRYIFNFEKIQKLEGFQENITWSLYAFDIAFLLLALTFLIKLLRNLAFLKKEKPEKADRDKKGQWPKTVLISSFLIILMLSTLLTTNQAAGCYQTVRIAQALVFLLIARHFLRSKKVFTFSTIIIFAEGILQAIIATAQFVTQKSVRLSWLGESLISPEILGVAKFQLHSEKIIRAYGTFPHPNILGAFLLLSLACGIYLFLNNQSYFRPQAQRKLQARLKFQISNFRILLTAGLGLIATGMVLTFSRSVWLATFIFVVVLFFSRREKILEKIKQITTLRRVALFTSAILLALLFLSILSPRLCYHCPQENSTQLRSIYSRYARAIITENHWLGIGPGNFTFIFKEKAFTVLKDYEIQPVHNFYLLIASEIGIVGLLFYLSLLWIFIFKNPLRSLSSPQTFFRSPLSLILPMFLLLGLFDHYFWTLSQGQLLFFLPFALQEKTH